MRDEFQRVWGWARETGREAKENDDIEAYRKRISRKMNDQNMKCPRKQGTCFRRLLDSQQLGTINGLAKLVLMNCWGLKSG